MSNEGIERRQKTAESLSRYNLKSQDDLISIAIIIDNLSLSQLSILTINEVNKLCLDYIGVNLHIFTEDLIPPCKTINCPAVGIQDLYHFNQYAIATSLSTLESAISSRAKKIFYYVFDITEFTDYTNLSRITKALKDDRISIIARCPDYRDIINCELQSEICSWVVKDLDLGEFVRIISNEKE